MVVYQRQFDGGEITLPPSKSAAHRALLCAALTGGRAEVQNVDASRDMEATLGALRALGAKADFDPAAKAVFLDGGGLGALSGGTIDCLESGSTLRFLIPLAAALGGTWRFVGRGRLPQRPLGVYEDLLPAHGVQLRREGGDHLPLAVSGRLSPGEYRLPGDVSSQFVTGLLLALPLLDGESRIVLTTPLESAGYVELTLSVLRDFGVAAEKTGDGWRVPGGQRYRADRPYTVEGDWSQAAFFLAMAALDPGGHTVRLRGLDPESVQGDRACVERFSAFGLDCRWENGALAAQNPRAGEAFGGLTGHIIDAAQIPDMVPALAAVGAFAAGETRIVNAGRLRLKESDRLAAMEDAVNALGGRARATPDSLVLTGTESPPGGTAQGCGDHRVVMALAAAAQRCRGPLSVTDERSVEKSYPGFFRDFRTLGGIAHVVDLG